MDFFVTDLIGNRGCFCSSENILIFVRSNYLPIEIEDFEDFGSGFWPKFGSAF